MMHCRMCSQRLTRPGKLCRECERELQRARTAAASVDTLSSTGSLSDAARMASADSSSWVRKMRSHPTVLVAAFSIGIATAATLHVVQRTHAAGKAESVMIDRDLRNIKPRDYHAASRAPGRVDVASATPSGGGMPARKPAAAAERRAPVVVAMAATGSRSADSVPSTGQPSTAGAAGAQTAPAYDRVLGLAAALDQCSNESLFARIACEHRARTRYCEGARQQIPQCAEAPPYEHRR